MTCHPERSEGSDWPGAEILRCAQDDKFEHAGQAMLPGAGTEILRCAQDDKTGVDR
jgi:hypothetical protein